MFCNDPHVESNNDHLYIDSEFLTQFPKDEYYNVLKRLANTEDFDQWTRETVNFIYIDEIF